MSKRPKHLVRYNISGDQRTLADFCRSVDELLINGNMAAFIPGGLASFLVRKLPKTPFVIDPMTHAFQHHRKWTSSKSKKKKPYELKSSLKALLNLYGDPLEAIVEGEKRGIRPSDINSDTAFKICERVIDTQRTVLSTANAAPDEEPYYTFLKQKGHDFESQLSPAYIVAPYFFIGGDQPLNWLPVNRRLAETASEQVDNQAKLAYQIVFDARLLKSDLQSREILECYKALPRPAVFFLWVSNFSEQMADELTLRRYVRFIRELEVPVQLLYGGYFTTALMTSGVVANLAGVGHGMEMGEYRDVVPVGGGVPQPKFYLPQVHDRLPLVDALRAIRKLGGMRSVEAFKTNICACPACKDLITSDPEYDFVNAYGSTIDVIIRRLPRETKRAMPSARTKENTLKHYLWVKQSEFKDRRTALDLATELEATAQTLRGAIPAGSISHCNRWAALLRNPD